MVQSNEPTQGQGVCVTEDAVRSRLRGLFRYAEVGRCVNAVTHDINNQLGVIMAYAELVLLEEALGEEPRRMLNDIIDGVTKCSRLINGLTTVARKEKPSLGIIDPGHLVGLVLDLRDYALKTDRIAVERRLGTGLPSITADVPKLQLAITYLLLNAQEALENAPAPRQLRVSLQSRDNGLAISVWNSGESISPEIADHIFEPFFTIKPGHHLGLGLAMAKEAAELHGGTLSYSPDEGFILFLPLENALSAAF